MFKQLFLPLIAVAAFILLVGIFVKNPEKLGIKPVSSPTSGQNQKLTIEGKTVDLLIADTNESRAKGLGGVTQLGESEGMLFVFDTKDVTPIFWMKDMLIDLDIIWINNNKVIQIDKNIKAPKEGTLDSELLKYVPASKVDYVLEVNAGFADKNGVKIGSETKFDL